MDKSRGRITHHLVLTTLIVAVAVVSPGCGGNGGRPKRTYSRTDARNPIAEAKFILEGYVAGRGDDSDQMLVPGIVAAAREADPAKADVIERGFADIKARPAAAATIAKKVLDLL